MRPDDYAVVLVALFALLLLTAALGGPRESA